MCVIFFAFAILSHSQKTYIFASTFLFPRPVKGQHSTLNQHTATHEHTHLSCMYVPLGGRYQTAARVIRVSSSPFDKLCSYTRIERWLLCSVDLPPMGMRLNNDPCTFVGNHRQLKGLSNILLSIIFVYVHRDSARLPVAALLMFLAQASLTTGTQLPLCGSVCVWWQLV